jgi:hypothetical protein
MPPPAEPTRKALNLRGKDRRFLMRVQGTVHEVQ